MAVTLLNWTNEPQKDVQIRLRSDRPVASVRSASQGRIRYKLRDGLLTLKMPVDTVDVLLVEYE